MKPVNEIKSVMSNKGSNNCCLCRSNEGIFTEIGMKQYKNIQDKLLRVLRVKNDLVSKTMCHKCIFKLEIVSQFCAQDATYNKKCIKCDGEGHEDLEITSPVILNKLRFVGCNLNIIDKKYGLLCPACYYKLELLEELKTYITINTFQASLGNDVGNVITNSERVFSVETLVCCGMVKVTEEVRDDVKTYTNITKVNVLKVGECSPKSVDVPTMKVEATPKTVATPKAKPLKKEKETKHVVKIKIRGKSDLVKQNPKHSRDSENAVEIIVNNTPKKRGRQATVKRDKFVKKPKMQNSKDDIGDIILHNDQPVRLPVIILKREDLNMPEHSPPSLRKRALKSVNKSKDDKKSSSSRVLKFQHELVMEIDDAELKENIPEDLGNVSQDSGDVPKEILKVGTDPDSDEDMPLNVLADNSAQREIIFDSLFETSDKNKKPENEKIPDETSEKEELKITISEEKNTTSCNNKEDSDVMKLSDDEDNEKTNPVCKDHLDKDESKDDSPEQIDDDEDTTRTKDVTEESVVERTSPNLLEQTKDPTDVQEKETSEIHDELALIAEHIKLTEGVKLVESDENSIDKDEKEQSEDNDEPATERTKENPGNETEQTDETSPKESLMKDIDKEVIMEELPEEVLSDELPEKVLAEELSEGDLTEKLPEKVLAEEEIPEKPSKDEMKISEKEPVVEDQIPENGIESSSSTGQDDEIEFKDSEKIAPITNSVKSVPSSTQLGCVV